MFRLKIRHFLICMFFLLIFQNFSMVFNSFASSVTVDKEICQSAGAELHLYASTGTDDCLYEEFKVNVKPGVRTRFGGQVLTWACDCGPNKCYDPLSKSCLKVGSEQMIKAVEKAKEFKRQQIEQVNNVNRMK